MRLYCGIDLHGNNAYLVVIDELDRVIFRCRLPNDLARILAELEPYRSQLVGVVVESTFNWYWLVDGLMDADYQVHLAHPAGIEQYSGLKHSDDDSDARWLAHLLRIGLLAQGYICPPEQRALRDLLRKRSRLVELRTSNLLSLQSMVQRNTGQRLTGRAVKNLDLDELGQLLKDPNVSLAAESVWRVMGCLDGEVKRLEQEALRQIKPHPLFKLLKSIAGVGDVLAPIIQMETGEISRFPGAGNYVSYCRGVGGQRRSNGKVKGRGNRKNGNPYLGWAWVEATHFAIRYHAPVRRFYERKKAHTHQVVALKAVAHKLARAGYYVMRDRVPFQIKLAFG